MGRKTKFSKEVKIKACKIMKKVSLVSMTFQKKLELMKLFVGGIYI
jgi:hypothetical protein